MNMLSNVRKIQTNIDRDWLILENQAAQISFAISKVIEHDKSIADLKNDNAELKTQLANLFSAVEILQNNPEISGVLDDKRKRSHLKLV